MLLKITFFLGYACCINISLYDNSKNRNTNIRSNSPEKLLCTPEYNILISLKKKKIFVFTAKKYT